MGVVAIAGIVVVMTLDDDCCWVAAAELGWGVAARADGLG